MRWRNPAVGTRWAFNYTDRPDRMDRRRGCCLLRVSNDCIHHRPISRDVLVLAISSLAHPLHIPLHLSLSLFRVSPLYHPLVPFGSSKAIARANVLKILYKVTTQCRRVSREQTRGEALRKLISKSRRDSFRPPLPPSSSFVCVVT